MVIPLSTRAAASSGSASSSVRGGHRFFQQIDASRAGAFGAIQHRALLDGGDARWNRNHHARTGNEEREPTLAATLHAADEVPKHRFGNFEIADHAVFQRTNR